MKRTMLALAVAASMTLVGCQETNAFTGAEKIQLDNFDKEVDREAAALTQRKLEADKEELARIKSEMEAKGMDVEDVYFTNDSEGKRQVVVVSENDDGSMVETMGYVAAGMAAGMIASHLLSSGSRTYVDRRSYEDRKKKRRGSYVSTIAATNKNYASAVTKSKPAYKGIGNIQSKATRAFGSTGARSSGYSFGG